MKMVKHFSKIFVYRLVSETVLSESGEETKRQKLFNINRSTQRQVYLLSVNEFGLQRPVLHVQ
jgi:hypothetical protein